MELFYTVPSEEGGLMAWDYSYKECKFIHMGLVFLF